MIRFATAKALRGVAAAATVLLLAGTLGAQSSGQQRLDPSAPIPYFIADGTGRRGFRDSDRELARWALESWQWNAGGPLRFVPGAEGDALVRVYWSDPAEGRYGEMRPLAVGDRRGAAVYIRPDMAALGPEIERRTGRDDLLRDSIVYLTCLHELGHALGLVHTDNFSDIMYSFGFGGDIVAYFERYRQALTSRSDIARVSGLSLSDRQLLRALYERP